MVSRVRCARSEFATMIHRSGLRIRCSSMGAMSSGRKLAEGRLVLPVPRDKGSQITCRHLNPGSR
jgi:hypothetical protein